MAYQKTGSSLNNIVVYDGLGNTILPNTLRVLGLQTAGFVKTDANGLFYIDSTGSGFQPLNANLTALSGLTYTAPGGFIKMTGTNTFVLENINSTASTLQAVTDNGNDTNNPIILRSPDGSKQFELKVLNNGNILFTGGTGFGLHCTGDIVAFSDGTGFGTGSGSGFGSGHTIARLLIPYAQREVLSFGSIFTVTDSAPNNATLVDFNSSALSITASQISNLNLQTVTDAGNTTTNSVILRSPDGTKQFELKVLNNGNILFTGGAGFGLHCTGDIVAFSDGTGFGTGTGSGFGSGHTIARLLVPYAQREVLSFGSIFTVTDDATNNATLVDFNAGALSIPTSQLTGLTLQAVTDGGNITNDPIVLTNTAGTSQVSITVDSNGDVILTAGVNKNFHFSGDVIAFSSASLPGSTWWDSLPIATATTLGGIKVGTGLTIDGSGVLSIGGGIVGQTTNLLTFSNSGSGASPGITFNGSTAVTVSYNTIGAAAASHTHAISDITGLQTALDDKLNGTSTSGNIAYWSGNKTLTGEAGFYWNTSTKRFGIKNAVGNKEVTIEVDSNGNIIFTAGLNQNFHFSGDVVAFSSLTPPVASWWDSLPIATASTLGGIKVGTGLSINGSGVLSVTTGSGVGSVTSVALSAPTGFQVSGSPVTSTGTLALSFASGYSLPTDASQTNWNTAYGWGNHATAGYQLTSQKGQANGYASLDGSGKVPVSQLPSAIMEYKGVWNASTNSPTLVNGTGDTGDVYRVSVAGTQNLGSGSISFEVGDYIIYNGTAWEKSDTTDAVASVNGFTGVVVLTTTNITEGTNLYYTDSRSRSAITLTTTGSSGAATYSSATGVLNIPTVTLAGLNATLQAVTTLGNTTNTGIVLTNTAGTKSVTVSVDTNGNIIFNAGTNQNFHFSGDVIAFSGLTPPASNWWDSLPIATTTTLGGIKVGSGLAIDGSGILSVTGAGVGSVTSVGLSMPGIFTVTNSPVTSSGTLTVSLNTQTANTVFAGPTTGAAAAPTFRSLVASDIPALSYQAVLNGTGYVKMSGTTVSYISSIPNADLTNSSITVQGTSVSLGGSVNVINGTGFVKSTGTTISYDNSTYLTTSAASSTYLPLSGGTLTGNLAANAASVSFRRFSIIPSGYIELNPINFRFDQDCLRYLNRWGTATITAPDFTSNELDALFSQYASNVNLQAKTPPVSIEVTGFNIGSSANNTFYPYVFLHSANQLGNVKMEVLKSGAPTVWETAYDGAIPSTGFVIAEYSSGSGNLIGVRWTFSNYTANPHYLRSIGCISRNGAGYAWNVIKGGDTMYGDLNFTSPYTVRVAGNQVLHAGNFSTYAEPAITAGTATQYWRGDKTFQTLNTTAVAEGTNQYFTTARVLATALTGYAVGTNTALAATDTVLGAFQKVQGQLNAKEPTITAGTTAQYWRGDKSWQTLNTAAVPESGNLYYTDARARAAISLTTTGSSGAATYSNSTGVLNIPTVTLAGLNATLQAITSLGNTTNTGIILTNTAATKQVTVSVDTNGNIIFNAGLDQNFHFSGDVIAFSGLTPPAANWWDSMPYATTTTVGGVKVDGTTIVINGSGVISSTSSGGTTLNGTGYVKMSGTTVSYVASIPNADLANSAITIQGTLTSLGGSVNVINGTGFVRSSGTTISYITGTSSQFVKADGSLDSTAYTTNLGTVTSVSGTGTVSGLTLTGTVTTSGSLTLGGTLAVTASNFSSQTANTFLAAPNGGAGVPTFRAIVAADIPTLNQNTTGSAGSVANSVTFNNGGSGDASGITYNGSAARTISYNTLGAAPLASPAFTGSPSFANTRFYGFTRVLPTVVNDTIEVGSATLSQGGGALTIDIVVPSSSFSCSKKYLLPINYAETAGAWEIANPIADGGSYSGNNYDLDINVNNNLLTLRLRRTAGSTAGTAYITLQISGNAATFTESSTTASVTAPTAYYKAAIITQRDGAAFINGNLTASQFIRSGGTASQFLKADGSIDSNTYLTGNQNISLTGDVSGSGTTSISTTLATVTQSTGSSFVKITLDTKGRVTGNTAVSATDLHNTFGTQGPNLVYASPNGGTGTPTFRAIVAADIPTLNQNTTGQAGSVAQSITFDNTGSGAGTGITYNGSTARTISYNTIGAAPLSHTHPWSSITSTPTTLSGYGITDAYTKSETYTKTEVDGFLQGLDPKASVKAATTGNITLANVQTIDGVSLSIGDRVLVKDQSTPSQNGIYNVVNAGSWTRATDMDTAAEFPGAYVFVEQGTTNADKGFVCTSDSVTVGTTNVTFVQFSGSGAYQSVLNGTGYVKMSGTTVSYLASIPNADLANSSITVQGTSVSLGGSINVISGTGFVKASGTSITYDNSTYYLASNPAGYTTNTGTVTSVAALTIGTSGTDLNSSVANGTTTAVITLNVPTASATARGALSSADWTTFNNKQNALSNPVTGTGTQNYIVKFTATGSSVGDSIIRDDGTNVGIGVAPLTEKLDINGTLRVRTINYASTAQPKFVVATANGVLQYREAVDILADIGGASAADFVTVSTAQTISGVKTFSSAIQSDAGLEFLDAQNIKWVGSYGNQAHALISFINNTGMAFKANGGGAASSLFLQDTADRRVGIGTESPLYKLDVNGTGRFSGDLTIIGEGTGTGKIGNAGFSSNYTGISLNGTLDPANYNILSSPSEPTLYINRTSGNAIRFREGNGADQMVIASGGAVTVTSSLTASSFVKSGGTASQFLMADGSVSTNPGWITSYTETDTLASVTGRGATTSTAVTFSGLVNVNRESTINVTTPGLSTAYGLHLGGQATADSATGITFSAGQATSSNANAGIYVQGSGAYGTKMYIATTDSYATGSKTAITIDQAGEVSFIRNRPRALGFTIWDAGNLTNLNQLTNGPGYITGNQSISITGDASGSGTTAITLTLATVNSNVGTFNNVTVNAKGLVTAASNVSYLTSYTETDTLASVTGRGATTSSNLTLDGIVRIGSGLTDTAYTRIVYPAGGTYVTTSSSITGAIRIKLPTQGSAMMMTCTVKVYEYTTNKSFTITFGGHRDSANWYNEFCYLDGDNARGELTVRFGVDGGKDCVYIGETNTVWSYPQVFVTDVQLGYTGYNSSWLTGWETTFVTSFATVNRTQTAYRKLTPANYNSYAPSLSGTGAYGSWSINVTGSSGSISGYNNPTTAATANTIAYRDANGDLTTRYFFGSYINTSDNDEAGITRFVIKNGDNYHRSVTTTTAADVIRGVASGSWGISITGNASTATSATTATNAYRVIFDDGPRDLSNRLPTTFTRTVVYDFVTSGTVGGTGNYAGVMTFSPWTGTTASTGDSSYQLAFMNESSVNGAGLPGLRLRKGIDSSWGSWYTLLHAGNYNSYSPTLTGGGASGTWGISITGNAATATTATSATSAVSATAAQSAVWLTSGNYITQRGSNGSWNADFQNTPAGTMSYGGDLGANGTNGPGGSWWIQENYRHTNSSNYWGTQIAWGWEDNANKLAQRNITAGSFGGWVYYLNSGNYNSYAPTLTGTGASGTWGISISGNAATATSAGNADTVDGYHASTSNIGNYIVVRDGNGYIFGNYINMTDDGNPGSGTSISSFITKQGDNYYRSVSPTNAMVSIRGVASGSWGINITGSAGSATSAGSVTNSITFATSGGAAAGSTYNGSVARTLSWNSIGALPQARVVSTSSTSSLTPDPGSGDLYVVTALNSAITINAPGGSPYHGQKLIIRITAQAAYTITWTTGSSGAYRASSDLTLPGTTISGRTAYFGFIYNADALRWDLIAKLENFA